MAKRLTTEQFIEKAKLIHGDNYDYSLVEYKNNKLPVKIKCNTCNNIFEQPPRDHLSGHGCKYCANNIKKTTEQFIQESKEKFGENFDYSLVKYKNNKTNIQLKCNICSNIFKQTPVEHLNSKGCPYCNKKVKKTTEQFIEEAKLIHGDNYDYSLVDYKRNNIKVKIKCNTCGNIFEQTPANHLQGHGCFNCFKNKFILAIDTDIDNYRQEYINLIKKAKENKVDKNYEIHHILPKSLFPLWKNKKSNLIRLSFEEHYKAHYLLYKIYNNYEMTLAFKFMLDITGKEYNPSLYNEIKQKINGRKIYCYELSKEYNSIVEAMKENNITGNSSIRQACSDWRYKSANYHWCYLEDKKQAIKYWSVNSSNGRLGLQVYCYELDSVFNSMKLAARNVGLKDISGIKKACSDWRYKSANYHWCYLEDKKQAIKYWNKDDNK